MIQNQEDQAVPEQPREEALSINLITFLKPQVRSQAYPNRERGGLLINR
jgi:hypothetical protein